MKKLFKQSLAVLLSATLLLTAATFASSAAEMAPQEESVGAESGKTGDCTWTLDNTGTLTISGNGAMKDYIAYRSGPLWDASPWGPWTGLTVKKAVIGDGVTHIGDYAFTDCIRLTSVSIPHSVTSIGEAAFYGTGLTSVSIPDSVTTIDSGAFLSCTGLTSVTIPDSVTSIGTDAFNGCTGLTSVTIPDSVTSIGGRAFRDCTGLTSVSIPDSVTSIGGYAFEGTTWANNQPDGVVYAGRVAYQYKGTMPDNTSIIIRDGTKGIAGYAFRARTGLTSVTIPDSVTSIGSNAFGNCTGLTSVMIPNSVTSIGGSAFSGCSGLTSVTIPDSVTSIGDYAFIGTTWYNNQPDGMIYAGRVAYQYKGTMPDNTSIIIRDGTKGIAGSAFSGCTGLTSVSIPDSVTSIGYGAFDGCTGLTSVTIPDSVTSIGDYAFDGCTGLTSVTIPDSVTSIGDYAFFGCTGLTSVTIPDSVTSIGEEAFEGCTGLTSVIIPDSVTSIGYKAFGYADYSKKIDGFTIYGVPGSAAEQYANDNGFEFIAVNLLECPNCHAALVIDAAVPPTYTATGLTEGLHCSVCGEVIKTQEILPKKPVDFTYGDLNGDDVVNVTDVTSVQRYLANLQTLTEQELGAADVNTDGKVTIDDVTLLQRYLAEFDVTIG